MSKQIEVVVGNQLSKGKKPFAILENQICKGKKMLAVVGNTLVPIWNRCSLLVGSGTNKMFIYSKDEGDTFTINTQSSLTGAIYKSICYGNGMYIAYGGTSVTDYCKPCVAKSNDGITWEEVTLPSTVPSDIEIGNVAFGNGVFVATGSSLSGLKGLMHSCDGITWVDDNARSGYVAFGNGIFVVIANNRVNESTDGINWTNRYVYTCVPRSPLGLIFLNGIFICVDSENTGYIRISTDAYTWTKAYVGVNMVISGAMFDSTNWRWYFVGRQYGAYTSDFVNFTTFIASPITSDILQGVCVNGKFFAGKSANYLYTKSDDGITWTEEQATANPMQIIASSNE